MPRKAARAAAAAPPRKARAAAAAQAATAAARAMLLTDLSLDEIGAVLMQLGNTSAYLERAEAIARAAAVCKAFKLAVQHAAKAHTVLCGKLFSLPTPKKNEPLLRVLRFAEHMMQMAQPTLAAGTFET